MASFNYMRPASLIIMKAQESTYDSVELAQIVHAVWSER